MTIEFNPRTKVWLSRTFIFFAALYGIPLLTIPVSLVLYAHKIDRWTLEEITYVGVLVLNLTLGLSWAVFFKRSSDLIKGTRDTACRNRYLVQMSLALIFVAASDLALYCIGATGYEHPDALSQLQSLPETTTFNLARYLIYFGRALSASMPRTSGVGTLILFVFVRQAIRAQARADGN